MDINDLYKSMGLEPPADGPPEDNSDGKHLKSRIDQTLGFDKRKYILGSKWYAIAASLALLLLFAAIYQFSSSDTFAMITVHVPAGETKKVNLPDGSTVWLNAASVLKFPARFGKTRTVYLEEGEGFFEIKRDTTAPFTVHSSNLDTRVLGTSFRVKAYKQLTQEVVTVISGKVEVSRDSRPVALLVKDEEVVFDKVSKVNKETHVEATEAIDWKSGHIILKSARFEDLVLAIENAYQVRVHFDRQKFRQCETSIRFSTSQTLESVMDLVRDIQGIRYEIRGKEVLVSGEGCL